MNGLDEHSIVIHIERDDAEKLLYIQDCDEAFQTSIVQKDNFSVLFEKICKNAFFISAFLNDGIKLVRVGYAAMYANDQHSKTAYITLICVKKSFQGDHIGSKILNQCFETAIKEGMETLRLEVLDNNDKAISFYKHHGFVIERNSGRGSYYMRKDLL